MFLLLSSITLILSEGIRTVLEQFPHQIWYGLNHYGARNYIFELKRSIIATLPLGIAIVFVFSPYIWKFSSYSQFQDSTTHFKTKLHAKEIPLLIFPFAHPCLSWLLLSWSQLYMHISALAGLHARCPRVWCRTCINCFQETPPTRLLLPSPLSSLTALTTVYPGAAVVTFHSSLAPFSQLFSVTAVGTVSSVTKGIYFCQLSNLPLLSSVTMHLSCHCWKNCLLDRRCAVVFCHSLSLLSLLSLQSPLSLCAFSLFLQLLSLSLLFFFFVL